MAILLIAVSFLTTLIAIKINNRQTDCLRSAFIKTSVIYGVIIAVITELLSFSRSLSFSYIVLWWTSLAVINSLILTVVIFYSKPSINSIKIKNQLGNYLRNQNNLNIISIAGFIVISSITLLTALLVPPYNYDSMTYHLPRVMHWIQNQTVAHFPTHNLRQISFAPGASYIVTHLQILSGGDRFANCVQWFAFFGSAIGTSLIVKHFGLIPLVSNLLRNVALNLPLAEFWKLVEKIHKDILKIDVNSPETSFNAGKSFDFNYLWWRITLPDDNYVGNAVHLILIFVAMLTFMLYLRKKRELSDVVLLAIANSTGFLLFCLLLKWQEWGNRLLLPFFILSSPVVGYFISRFLKSGKLGDSL
ncbi:hypothetical protein ACE1CI_11270 [Aerosakkonemataceae cyanobacterium BLCC-F50]|uniref:Uncharacterized protein n=1 Tax=Floridaenema flaviceps BLCC-F50 TaxID=3153642 RepID=A0ABV4XP56_9CYAN